MLVELPLKAFIFGPDVLDGLTEHPYWMNPVCCLDFDLNQVLQGMRFEVPSKKDLLFVLKQFCLEQVSEGLVLVQNYKYTGIRDSDILLITDASKLT